VSPRLKRVLWWAVAVIAGCFVSALGFTLCTGTEQCIDGRTEFSGRVCP
jgi:hypothetical protein